MGMGDTPFFRGVNVLTAVISITTAAYLMPFVPTLLDGADKLYLEATASKEIIEKLYPEQIRQRLLRRSSLLDNEQKMVGTSRAGSALVEQIGNRSRKHGKLGDRTQMRRRIQDFLRRRSSKDSSITSTSSDEDSPNNTDHNPASTKPTTAARLIPIADDFDQASIMFADISNFTYWSSQHSPIEVFTLLESIFFEFDRIANELGVYKVSTVGDCYIAVTGVPCPTVSECLLLK
jgi:hypothetical protein